MKCASCFRWLAAIAILSVSATFAHAEALTFTIDPAQSVLELTEIHFNPFDIDLEHQEPGVSNFAEQMGTIDIDVDDVNNPSTILFTGGAIEFIDSGNWLPDLLGGTDGDPGTAQPGAYGTEFVHPELGIDWLYSVFRDSVFQLIQWDELDGGGVQIGKPDPIPVTAGSFPWDDPNGQVMADVTAGSWDWNISAPALGFTDHNGGFDPNDDDFGEPTDGADNLNTATTPGTYAVAGNTVTLTIPFHARLGEDPFGDPSDLLAVFDGTIVATASLASFDPADFDEDGDVDGDDFLTWQASFNVDAGGDTDNDGDTDGDDFLNWQAAFGSGSGNASGAVPEPASAGLAILAALACAVAAVRKRLG